MKLLHKALDFEVRQIGNPDDRTLEFIGSTAHVDRYGDIIEVEGWDLKNYKKNPVFLWAHDYRQPPVGKAVKVWAKDGALKFHVKFPTFEEYPFADTIYKLYLGGYLAATSVGFQDLEREPIIDKKNEGKQTGWRYLKQELYELSAVPVPANPYAVMQDALGAAVQKGVISEQEGERFLEEESKGVIPFKSYPTDTGSWDGPKEVAAAEVADLKVMCTWVDSAKPDVKGSYKLPHHRAGNKHVVWRGVSAAMARLMQAGTQIPDGDRKGCYNHLSKHYAQFDKTPPAFKTAGEYSSLEILRIYLDWGPETTDENLIAALQDLQEECRKMRARAAELEAKVPHSLSVEEVEEAVIRAMEKFLESKGVKGGQITDYLSLVLNPGYEPQGGRQAGEERLEIPETFGRKLANIHKNLCSR